VVLFLHQMDFRFQFHPHSNIEPTMKHRFISIVMITLIIVLLSSCDEISAPYKQTGGVVVVTGEQKVLIEDFTGFRCGNCPSAAQIAAELHKAYEGKVIVLGIHSGATFASPRGKLYAEDFRTPVGEELFTTFLGGTGGQPNGMVNRSGDGNKIVAPDGWAAQVAKELEKTAKATIDLKPTYDSVTKLLTVDVDVKWISAGGPDDHLAIYLSEDSIVYAQKDYRRPSLGLSEDDSNFVHMHMLRGAIGEFGTWGEQVASKAAGSSITKRYTVSFAGKPWKSKHCSVIGILHNKQEGSIIQVNDQKIK
ncbi:MAG: Omp28 family outer membrane lipoprotein, partial [Bacteroidota bacterium]